MYQAKLPLQSCLSPESTAALKIGFQKTRSSTFSRNFSPGYVYNINTPNYLRVVVWKGSGCIQAWRTVEASSIWSATLSRDVYSFFCTQVHLSAKYNYACGSAHSSDALFQTTFSRFKMRCLFAEPSDCYICIISWTNSVVSSDRNTLAGRNCGTRVARRKGTNWPYLGSVVLSPKQGVRWQSPIGEQPIVMIHIDRTV